jgi:D-tyrosyl-tRNA(Tyr) deacylase
MMAPRMRAVCQRVSRARVTIAGDIVGEIEQGLVVLLGIARDDTGEIARRAAHKVARLRIFEDDSGKFARSVLDVGGATLVVSQFTLIADTAKGNRPSFADAAPQAEAEPLYDAFCAGLESEGVPAERGNFGARMAVDLVNDGPVTIVLDV